MERTIGLEGIFASPLEDSRQVRAVVSAALAHRVLSHRFRTADLERLTEFQAAVAEELTVLAVGHSEDERLSPVEGIPDHPRGISGDRARLPFRALSNIR